MNCICCSLYVVSVFRHFQFPRVQLLRKRKSDDRSIVDIPCFDCNTMAVERWRTDAIAAVKQDSDAHDAKCNGQDLFIRPVHCRKRSRKPHVFHLLYLLMVGFNLAFVVEEQRRVGFPQVNNHSLVPHFLTRSLCYSCLLSLCLT